LTGSRSLGIISIVGISLGIVVLKIINKRAEICTKKMEDIQSSLAMKIIEYIRGISILRSFNMIGGKKME
jgi:ATP-binding cassette subfamily B protein